MTPEDSQSFIDGLLKIANSDKVKELCEPNVMSHEDLKDFHVKRLWYARKLMEDTLIQKAKG